MLDDYEERRQKKEKLRCKAGTETSGGNIKVCCRFRPFNGKYTQLGGSRLYRLANSNHLLIKDNKQEEISFMFDQVFDSYATQEEIFEVVGRPVLSNILDGFNGTIMAYGQTSSGKTFTMQGNDLSDKEKKGIMPRLIEQLFAQIGRSTYTVEYKLKVSIFEIYLYKVRDLLEISKQDLRIRYNKQGCYIEGLTDVYVGDRTELFRLLTAGQKNRITCSTNMNEHSSRSHMIFLLNLNQLNTVYGTSKTSKLFLVDLAGSEKVSKTGAYGKVLEYAKRINLSLTSLGKVIKTLAEKNCGEKIGHISYRDSKLTRILKDSLGGNSKTTLIVTCSPHELHHPYTLSTLRFGYNAQKIRNKPKINRYPTIQYLYKIIERLEGECFALTGRINYLERHISEDLHSEVPKDVKFFAVIPAIISEYLTDRLTDSSLYVSYKVYCSYVQPLPYISHYYCYYRIRKLYYTLTAHQNTMQYEMEKYYQLKKQYSYLHLHLREILTENIKFQEEVSPGRSNAIKEGNSGIVKLIVGEIFSLLGKEKEAAIVKQIEGSYWYKLIMIEDCSCSDYWHNEKEEINRQFYELLNESKRIESTLLLQRKKEDSSSQRENYRVIYLYGKLDRLFVYFQDMLNLQTTWKAYCQLYERKLKQKYASIDKLESKLEELSYQLSALYREDLNQDYLLSNCTNIVKPIKGGVMFHH